MNDQPREEKAPEGPDQPTVEQPTVQQAHGGPAAQPEPTAAVPGEPATQATPPGQPAAPEAAAAASGQPEATATMPGQGEPAAQAAPGPAETAPGDAGAAHGQQPPPQFSQPGPGHAYGAWGPPPAAPRQPGGFRRFVGHRATQLVGVGVLGVLLGGGIVGGIAAATHHPARPGIHRQYGGPNQGFDGRGPGSRGGGHHSGNPGNPGNSGNSGSGNGI